MRLSLGFARCAGMGANMNDPKPLAATLDAREAERALRLIVDPGRTFELRIFDERDFVHSGYFVDPAVAVKSIAHLAKRKKLRATYVTLNPVRPELRARRSDRLETGGKLKTTSDGHIARRTRLLVDIDAERVADISSTEAEHAAALALASEIAFDLTKLGWSEPLVGDSGNGAHLIFGIDLPPDDGGLVERVLATLQAHYGSTTTAGIVLKVDVTVANPARISKLYGTAVRKGDNTSERPHRMARVISAPARLDVTTEKQLRALVAESEASRKPAHDSPRAPHAQFDVERWLSVNGIEVKRNFVDETGREIWVLAVCPFNSEHDRGEAHVHRMRSGQLGAACKHETCKWGWVELRERFEPSALRPSNNPPRLTVAPKPPKPPKLRAKLVTAADVVERRVEWLWGRRIPLGMITFLDGDPGLGKSVLNSDLAARVSRGLPMPFELPPGRPPADVIFMASEDVIATTAVPRLRVANADLSRVHYIESMPTPADPDAPPALDPDRLQQLEEVIAEKRARLVVIDPLFNHLPSGVDANKDQDVRTVLKPLAAMADRYDCAIVIVRHLKKGAGSALTRGSGSIGLAAAARSVLLLAKNPQDPSSPLYLAQTKSSVGERATTVEGRLVAGDDAPKFQWHSEAANVTADDLAKLPEASTASQDNDADDGLSEREACEKLIRALLAEGPMLSKEFESDLREATGASKTTIKRARNVVGVVARKRSTGEWEVQLPGWETLKSAKSPGARAGDTLDADAAANQLSIQANCEESKRATSKGATGEPSDLTPFDLQQRLTG